MFLSETYQEGLFKGLIKEGVNHMQERGCAGTGIEYVFLTTMFCWQNAKNYSLRDLSFSHFHSKCSPHPTKRRTTKKIIFFSLKNEEKSQLSISGKDNAKKTARNIFHPASDMFS